MNARIVNQMIVNYYTAQKALLETPYEGDPEGHRDAKTWLDSVRLGLKVMVWWLKWGQCGALFVTDRKVNESGERIRTVHVNGRTRIICHYSIRHPNAWRLDVVSAEQAEADYQAKRAAGRTREQMYREHRSVLVFDLLVLQPTRVRDFGEWVYTPGQKGGTFHRKGQDVRIAAYRSIHATGATIG